MKQSQNRASAAPKQVEQVARCESSLAPPELRDEKERERKRSEQRVCGNSLEWARSSSFARSLAARDTFAEARRQLN